MLFVQCPVVSSLPDPVSLIFSVLWGPEMQAPLATSTRYSSVHEHLCAGSQRGLHAPSALSGSGCTRAMVEECWAGARLCARSGEVGHWGTLGWGNRLRVQKIVLALTRLVRQKDSKKNGAHQCLCPWRDLQ